jgi:hypothetical protein
MVLTGREKATIFLSILGADISSRILRYLPNELADLIAAGINHLPTPSPEALSEVMGEYQSFLALPEAAPQPVLAQPVVPQKSYAVLMYERPQMIAFLISLLPQEERTEALRSLPRERAMVEELLNTLKPGPLRPKLEAVFAGKIF